MFIFKNQFIFKNDLLSLVIYDYSDFTMVWYLTERFRLKMQSWKIKNHSNSGPVNTGILKSNCGNTASTIYRHLRLLSGVNYFLNRWIQGYFANWNPVTSWIYLIHHSSIIHTMMFKKKKEKTEKNLSEKSRRKI